MRPRDRETGPFDGARHGVARGLVGIGFAIEPPPATLDEAIIAVHARHGAKAGRMLASFAEKSPEGYVWTRTGEDEFRLGRICGPWRYDDSPEARATGIRHVRAAEWLPEPFGTAETPAAVVETFARGGRNFQQTHDEEAESVTDELWRRSGPVSP